MRLTDVDTVEMELREAKLLFSAAVASAERLPEEQSVLVDLAQLIQRADPSDDRGWVNAADTTYIPDHQEHP
jgi:hypothetical protein